MPFFPRRFVEKMLIDLDCFLDSRKKRDIQSRYDGKNHSDKIGAEAELALMWAFYQEGFDISVEPLNNDVPGSKNPDLLITGIVDKPIIADITTISGSDDKVYIEPNSLLDIDGHNTLNKTLRRKNKQLKNISYDPHYKAVFIWDGGWPLIRGHFLTPNNRRERVGNDNLTLEAFCRWHRAKASFDCVCVICPYRKGLRVTMARSPMEWGIFTVPDRLPFGPSFSQRVRESLTHLPEPLWEPYQVKTLNKQGAFNDTNWPPRWNGTTITNGCTMRISAKLVQLFLAGEIDQERFEYEAFGRWDKNDSHPNFFKLYLDQGKSIESARIISCGHKCDEDIIEFKFKEDIAIKKFRDLDEGNS